jgi:hypothetical protein
VYANQATVVVEAGASPAGPATALVTVEEGILLEEHFEQGIGDWTKFMNYWRLKEEQWYWGQAGGVGGSGAANHECCGDSNKEAEDAVLMYLEDGAEAWTDYRMEVKFNLKSGDRAVGVWVRGQHDYRDDGSGQWITGYYVVVGGKVGGAQHFMKIVQLQTATDCWDAACNNPGNLYDFNNPHDLILIEGMEGGLTRNVWHTLVVEVRGATIKAWLDHDADTDAPDIEFTDPKEPFLTGAVGFKTMAAELISYDDVYVWPLE